MVKNVVLLHIYFKRNENKGHFSLCSGRLFVLTLGLAVVINCTNSEANWPLLNHPDDETQAMQQQSPPRRPEITYPCLWSYKIIGEDQDFLREALLLACAPHPVDITHSRASSGGKYHSMEGKLVVQDEATRLAIFDSLKTHPAVKILF